MKLKIRLEDIPPEGLDLPVDIDEGQAQARMMEAGGEAVSLSAPVNGRLRFERVGSRLVLRGSIRTTVKASCARCLDDFDQAVDEDVLVVYTSFPEGGDPEELEAESLSMELIEGDHIDLWPVIQEQLLLAQPIKALCREDCGGLCPVCGANQNLGPCRCQKSGGHPAFGALKDIQEKLPQ